MKKENTLLSLAKEVSKNAYSPYSNFRVGCALVTTAGDVFTGCNVENISYGLTTCAERVAIFNAVSHAGKIEIKELVLYTPTTSPNTPCGACRQVIGEFSSICEITCICDSEEVLYFTGKDLLPFGFEKKE